MEEQKLIHVTFYHRKPRKVGNYSVEFIFDDVRKRLSRVFIPKVAYSHYESSGVLKRFYNCVEAMWKQGDVNHVTGDINYLGLFLSKRKTIQTILDCIHLQSSSGIKYKILKYFWLTIPARNASYLTAISNSTKSEILKHEDIDPEKIKVIHVAISENYKYVPKEFNSTRPRILQVGTAPNKNIDRLIDALKGMNCILEIIGKQNPEYEEKLKTNDISFEYKSGLSDEEMVRRYIDADIIALVSTYEGFGMPILEGQATGRVVITSDAFSMPEVAGDGACLVDPFKVESIRAGLTKIINDDQYRNKLIANGLENVKRFHPQKIATQYMDLYQQVHNQQ
jgi:glycosyltransferase involved in cell wall biosynthesis